ncbi:MAG TPA: hypothetical protein VN259_09555 [Xanthomonadales bacterium]|nr:hypothetical protein [Xanthomonadales bacterium]
MKTAVEVAASRAACSSLKPWFLAAASARACAQCRCDCSWTGVLSALQEAGPVALVLPGPISASEAPRVLAAGLALGCDWTLRADVHRDGIDESLEWSGVDSVLRVHALPSSNWRPFDRLARLHQQREASIPAQRQSRECVAVPLLVDADFNLRLLHWSRLTLLDQEQARDWMLRTRIRPLLP